jgi:GAF domain-containing protein
MDTLTPLTFAEKARDLAGASGLEAILEGIVALALETVACDYGSVTLVHADGSVETVASSHPVVSQADQLQYTLAEGPCLTAAATNGVYVIDDTSKDERWPRWGPAVSELGLSSVLSIHLFTDQMTLGALNLYARDLHSYDADEVNTGRIVAAHASVALARVRGEQNLWRAIDSRHLIGTAQGILMERFSITAEQAFSVLRRYSQSHNAKLHDIASRLVTTGQLPQSSEDDAKSQLWTPGSAAPTEGESV